MITDSNFLKKCDETKIKMYYKLGGHESNSKQGCFQGIESQVTVLLKAYFRHESSSKQN
jgi:hypothetical protein